MAKTLGELTSSINTQVAILPFPLVAPHSLRGNTPFRLSFPLFFFYFFLLWGTGDREAPGHHDGTQYRYCKGIDTMNIRKLVSVMIVR